MMKFKYVFFFSLSKYVHAGSLGNIVHRTYRPNGYTDRILR